MQLSESILFSYSILKNKKFQKDKTVKEIAAFFLGVLAVESRFLEHNEIGEGYWIVKFEEFATNFLNSELNSFNDQWEETIGTSWSKWIYEHQINDEDGLNRFHKILDKFIQQENNLPNKC